MSRNEAIIGHWRNSSCSRLWPNVAQIIPLIGGLCLPVDFDQMWSKMCPLLEDFVSLRTLTKCGPKCALCWRTLSHCGLWPNMVRKVPPLQDFASLRTSTRCGQNMCPSSEDFVMLRISTKCGPNMCPLMEDFILLRSLTTYGSTTYSSSKRASTQKNGLYASIDVELKPPSLITLPHDQYTGRYPYQKA